MKIIEHLKEVHPLGIAAAVGAVLFSFGGAMHLADTIPLGFMWLGGALMAISALLALSG